MMNSPGGIQTNSTVTPPPRSRNKGGSGRYRGALRRVPTAAQVSARSSDVEKIRFQPGEFHGLGESTPARSHSAAAAARPALPPRVVFKSLTDTGKVSSPATCNAIEACLTLQSTARVAGRGLAAKSTRGRAHRNQHAAGRRFHVKTRNADGEFPPTRRADSSKCRAIPDAEPQASCSG